MTAAKSKYIYTCLFVSGMKPSMLQIRFKNTDSGKDWWFLLIRQLMPLRVLELLFTHVRLNRRPHDQSFISPTARPIGKITCVHLATVSYNLFTYNHNWQRWLYVRVTIYTNNWKPIIRFLFTVLGNIHRYSHFLRVFPII